MPLLLFILVVIIVSLYCLLRFYAPFGGRTPAQSLQHSPQFKNGIFINTIPTSMQMSMRTMLSIYRDFLRRDRRRSPGKPLQPKHPTVDDLQQASEPALLWFGHSAALLRLHHKTLLLDPMLGPSPSPFPFAGPKRFAGGLPMTAAELPHIDALLISHDHYDHLDYPTITQLHPKTDRFFVPLGVRAHLERWGVPTSKITELDWWDEIVFDDLTIACTPARHFSGRTLSDRFKTLWCSWVIASKDASVFFSGDTGYGPHFKQIGQTYGPFDLTLMECGQYDTRWPDIHMMPEQTLTAHHDLRGKRLFPLHWGAFVLALHAWDDPVERLRTAAGSKTTIVTPVIGQIVPFTRAPYPHDAWWRPFR